MDSTFRLLSQYNKNKQLSENPDHASVSISYNNANLQFLGRWIDTGSGKWTGWNGSKIIFNVSGTSLLTITASIVDADAASLTACAVFIDYSYDGTLYNFTSTTDVYTGTKVIYVPLPNDNRTHTVEIFTAMNGPACFATTQNVTLKAYLVGSTATLSTTTLGSKKVQCIGDSWCANINSWPRLMDMSRYQLYPTANSSYTLANMNSDYNYDYTGVLNTTDPTMDAVIISSGVNDYTGSVTVPNFQTTLLSLIDKIQIKQPNVPIFLVRVPNNGSSLYGQYGTAMSNAAGLRTGVTYIDTSSLDASMVFLSDGAHLNGGSKKILATFVSDALVSAGI